MCSWILTHYFWQFVWLFYYFTGVISASLEDDPSHYHVKVLSSYCENSGSNVKYGVANYVTVRVCMSESWFVIFLQVRDETQTFKLHLPPYLYVFVSYFESNGFITSAYFGYFFSFSLSSLVLHETFMLLMNWWYWWIFYTITQIDSSAYRRAIRFFLFAWSNRK